MSSLGVCFDSGAGLVPWEAGRWSPCVLPGCWLPGDLADQMSNREQLLDPGEGASGLPREPAPRCPPVGLLWFWM